MKFAFFDDYPHERGHHPDLIMGLGVAAHAPVYCPEHFLEGRTDRADVVHVPMSGALDGSPLATRRNMEESYADAVARGREVFVNLFFDENWDSFPLQAGPLRVVHTLHRPAELTGELGGANAEKSGDAVGLLKQLGGADLFVTHTAAGERQLLNWLPQRNVVRVGWPSASTAEVEARFAAPSHEEQEPYVLLIGEAREYKGIDCLLEAVNPGPWLRIAGHLPGGRELVSHKYPKARVSWEPDWITPGRMHQLIEGATVVVFPYLRRFAAHGGVSAALVQALTFGKPIIVSEAISSQAPPSPACLTIPAKDASALRKAIAHVMKHPDEFRQAALALRDYVLREHTYEGHLARIAEALADV